MALPACFRMHLAPGTVLLQSAAWRIGDPCQEPDLIGVQEDKLLGGASRSIWSQHPQAGIQMQPRLVRPGMEDSLPPLLCGGQFPVWQTTAAGRFLTTDEFTRIAVGVWCGLTAELPGRSEVTSPSGSGSNKWMAGRCRPWTIVSGIACQPSLLPPSSLALPGHLASPSETNRSPERR